MRWRYPASIRRFVPGTDQIDADQLQLSLVVHRPRASQTRTGRQDDVNPDPVSGRGRGIVEKQAREGQIGGISYGFVQ
jgi:hypothetical protein